MDLRLRVTRRLKLERGLEFSARALDRTSTRFSLVSVAALVR